MFSITRAGYRALLRWMRSYGDVRRVGVEGSGSYGAGVTPQLVEAGIEVLEVDRPTPATGGCEGSPTPWTPRPRQGRPGRRPDQHAQDQGRRGGVAAVLRLTRSRPVRSRTVALQLLRHHIVSAPEELRDQVRNLTSRS